MPIFTKYSKSQTIIFAISITFPIPVNSLIYAQTIHFMIHDLIVGFAHARSAKLEECLSLCMWQRAELADS